MIDKNKRVIVTKGPYTGHTGTVRANIGTLTSIRFDDGSTDTVLREHTEELTKADELDKKEYLVELTFEEMQKLGVRAFRGTLGDIILSVPKSKINWIVSDDDDYQVMDGTWILTPTPSE